jgi:acyl carrier protein
VTPPTTDVVLTEIRRIAEAELDLRGAVEARSELVRDLGLDSLGAMVLAVGLENRFRVKLDEQDAGTLRTVADLVALVQRRCEEARRAQGA